MNIFKRKLFWLLLGGSALLLVVFAKVVVPWGTVRQIKASVEENCESCELNIKRARFSVFFPTRLVLEEVRLTAGEKGATEVDAWTDRIEARVSVIPLLLGHVHFDAIQIDRPKVIVTDGDLNSSPSRPQPESRNASLFDFRIQATRIEGGEFAYIRNYRGTHAVFRIGHIRGEIGELGTVPELRERVARARVWAQVENSGEVEVIISPYLFAPPLRVGVEVKVHDQNLADLSSFFGENDGVFLKGQLLKGRALVAVKERKLTSEVWAKYQGLDVTLKKTVDRSAWGAFVANLGETLTVNQRNAGKRPADQTREVALDREKDESLVSFILRGMKEAALKVASAKGSSFE